MDASKIKEVGDIILGRTKDVFGELVKPTYVDVEGIRFHAEDVSWLRKIAEAKGFAGDFDTALETGVDTSAKKSTPKKKTDTPDAPVDGEGENSAS